MNIWLRKVQLFFLLLFRKVRLFIIDAMHTIDGCVLRVAIYLLFAIGFDSDDKWKHILGYKPADIAKVEKVLKCWRSNVTRDFARQPRALKDIRRWKMRETHTAGVYLIPALQAVPELAAYFRDVKRKQFFPVFMHLIAGIRLVYNFSHKPLPKVLYAIFNFEVVHIFIYIYEVVNIPKICISIRKTSKTREWSSGNISNIFSMSDGFTYSRVLRTN